MVNLALMDRVLEVDKEKKTVRVEAGIRVQQLVDGIKDYGLTLQNFASIREQQIGGIVQVGLPCLAFLFFSVLSFLGTAPIDLMQVSGKKMVSTITIRKAGILVSDRSSEEHYLYCSACERWESEERS